MNNLSCTCRLRLDGVSPAELERLFPEPSSTAPLLSLVNESGLDGFTMRRIVVTRDDVPILLLPLFESRFDLSVFVQGWVRKSLKVAGRLIPSIFHPRILGVGSVEGEWSEIGIDPHIDADTLNASLTMAFSAVNTLAAELKSDIVALYNFNQYSRLPGEVFKNYNQVHYRPCSRLSVTFNSMEEYLSSLSRGARKDLRRKLRVAPMVRIIRSRTVSPFLDRIYTLYLKTVERSPMALGMHNSLFFEKFCERVPDAEYTLFFVDEELVAFNLLIVKKHAMIDVYFCMDHDLGRTYNLYFLSWFENVRICVERKIPLYYAGQGTEETKAHLGAAFIPSFILFKHRQPLFDRLLAGQPAVIGKILSRLRFWPRMEIHAQRY